MELIKSSWPDPARFVVMVVMASIVLSVTLPNLFNLLCCKEVTFSCESVPLLMLPLQLPNKRFFTICGVSSSLDGDVGVPGINTSVSSSPVQQYTSCDSILENASHEFRDSGEGGSCLLIKHVKCDVLHTLKNCS